MAHVKILVPYGAVGLNCSDEAFANGLALQPDYLLRRRVHGILAPTTWGRARASI